MADGRSVRGDRRLVGPPKPCRGKVTRMQSQRYTDNLASPGWKARRDHMLDIANNRCEWCSGTNVELQVHHLHYRTLGKEDPTDLIVLCDDCHLLIHNPGSEPDQAQLARIAFAHPATFQDWLSLEWQR